jgi:hypothetical protein
MPNSCDQGSDANQSNLKGRFVGKQIPTSRCVIIEVEVPTPM